MALSGKLTGKQIQMLIAVFGKDYVEKELWKSGRKAVKEKYSPVSNDSYTFKMGLQTSAERALDILPAVAGRQKKTTFSEFVTTKAELTDTSTKFFGPQVDERKPKMSRPGIDNFYPESEAK